MAKDRLIPCKNYINEGNCEKGHEGTFKKSCQHCKDYRARASVEVVNRKKEAERKRTSKVTKEDLE